MSLLRFKVLVDLVRYHNKKNFMNKKFYVLLLLLISFNSQGSMKAASDKDLPSFEGFKSNDSLQIEKYLKKAGFHESAPYKLEIYCEYKIDSKNKFLGKSKRHVCEYRKIQGFAGSSGFKESDN